MNRRWKQHKYFENSQMNIQGSTTKGYSGRCHVFEFKAKVRPKKPALRLQGFALVAEHFRRKIGKWLFLRNLQARINRQKLHKESCSSYDFNTSPCASMQVKYNSSHKNRSTTARSKSLPGYPWNPEMLHQVKASKQKHLQTPAVKMQRSTDMETLDESWGLNVDQLWSALGSALCDWKT